MKKSILIGLILTGSLLTFSFTSKNEKETTFENSDCNYGQCSAFKQNGQRCLNCCQQGSAYCWSHNHQ